MNSELIEEYVKFLHERNLRNARKNLAQELRNRRIDYKVSGVVQLGVMNEIMYETLSRLNNEPDKTSEEYNDLLRAFNDLEGTTVPIMHQMPNAIDYFYTNNKRFSTSQQSLMDFGLRIASSLILNHYDNFQFNKETKIERLDEDTPVIDIDLEHFKEIISEPIMFAYTSVYGKDISDITEIPDAIDRHLDVQKQISGKSYSKVEFLKALINIYKELESVNKKSITQLRAVDLEHYL